MSSLTSKFSLKNKNNFKIWHLKGYNHCIIGGVGALRDINLVSVNSNLLGDSRKTRKEIDFDIVVTYFVSTLFKIFEKNHRLIKDAFSRQSFSSSYILAFEDKVFEIGGDGSVIEIDDYTAIGSGAEIALGSLNTTEDLDPIERITKAIEASCKTNLYVNYPIVIGTTEDKELVIITNPN